MGYCGHFGGEKPPPPMVPLMQHSGPLVRSNQKAPCHHPVIQGGGTEEKEDRGGGTSGELLEGLSGLWRSFGECDVFQVYG